MPFRFKQFARGTRHKSRGETSALELEYGEVLRLREHAGELAWVRHHPFGLRLADRTFYHPDYAVMRADGVLEVYEVKGFWEEDARVKIKVAAEQFPFPFIAVTRRKRAEGGGWELERFGW